MEETGWQAYKRNRNQSAQAHSFSLEAAKARVANELEETAPTRMKRFWRTNLCHRLLHFAVLYFVAWFQLQSVRRNLPNASARPHVAPLQRHRRQRPSNEPSIGASKMCSIVVPPRASQHAEVHGQCSSTEANSFACSKKTTHQFVEPSSLPKSVSFRHVDNSVNKHREKKQHDEDSSDANEDAGNTDSAEQDNPGACTASTSEAELRRQERDLAQEAEEHFQEMAWAYAAIILRYSDPRAGHQDTRFFESLYLGVSRVVMEAFSGHSRKHEVEHELHRVFRGSEFNPRAREDQGNADPVQSMPIRQALRHREQYGHKRAMAPTSPRARPSTLLSPALQALRNAHKSASGAT